MVKLIEFRAVKNPSLIVSIMVDKMDRTVKFSGSSVLVEQDVADALEKDVRNGTLYRRITLAEETLEKLQADASRAALALKEAQDRAAEAAKKTDDHINRARFNLPNDPLDNMTLAQLQEYAVANHIDIPADVTKKNDVLAIFK